MEAATQAAWGAYWLGITPHQKKTALEDMERAIAAYEAAMWQPIAMAPADGTRVLVFSPSAGSEYPAMVQRVDWWRDGGWWQMRPGHPYAHWRPLPAGPGAGA